VRTGRPLVVDALLVRAADDAVHHGDGANPEPVEERQDLLRGVLVLADVGPFGEPAPELGRLLVRAAERNSLTKPVLDREAVPKPARRRFP
jgi:hypothetical protein